MSFYTFPKKNITISVLFRNRSLPAPVSVRNPGRSKCVPFPNTFRHVRLHHARPVDGLGFGPVRTRSDLPIDLWRCFVAAAARRRNSFEPARAARGPTTTVVAGRTSAPRSGRSPSKRRRRHAWSLWHRRVSSLQNRNARSYEIRDSRPSRPKSSQTLLFFF